MEERITSATKVFYLIRRLSNTSKGLSFQAIRQLYLACIATIGDYGVQIWWNHQKNHLQSYQKLQSAALRQILGAFKTTPITPMEIEAAIPPVAIRFESICKKYGLRILQMAKNHPIRRLIIESRIPIGCRCVTVCEHPETVRTLPKLTPNHTQLSKILQIFSDIKLNSIEKLDLQRNTPWESPLQAEPLSNKEQIIDSFDDFERSVQSDLVFYTDGSKLGDGATGAGTVQIFNGIATPFSWYLGKKVEVFDAELFATMQAARCAQKISQTTPNLQNIWILTDSQAVWHRLQNAKPKPGQILISKVRNLSTQLQTKGIQLRLKWIPSHSGISGNEQVDKAAKQGARNDGNIAQKHEFVSFAYLRRLIKESVLTQWQQHWENHQNGRFYLQNFQRTATPKWKPTKIIAPKRHWSALMQLKFGHGYFKSYLVRTPNFDDPNCFHGCNTSQTPEHLLFVCKNYVSERKIMLETINTRKPTLSALFANDANIKATLTYIKDTGIATRTWFDNHTTAKPPHSLQATF